MQYYFCPRCNFRMLANKPLCPTCGFKIPRKVKSSKTSLESPVQAQNAPTLWSKLFKWDFASHTSEKTESA